MQCCFFEDETARNFAPLTLTRPIDDLRTGILTLGEKWRACLPNVKWTRSIRKELEKNFANELIDKNEFCFWINSRFTPNTSLLNEIKKLSAGQKIISNEAVVAVKVDGATALKWQNAGQPEFDGLSTAASVQTESINYLWDLFLINSNEIAVDLERLNHPSSSNIDVSSDAALINEENIFINEGAKIQAGAILIAENGPIFIGKNADLSAGVIIEGPAAICEGSVIKPGAKIHANTTIGLVCKVGGEVSDTIFHSYSNKAHDGYLGNSLIGQWCNFGAGTNNSNLKNNYSNVRLTDWHSGKITETGQQFLGLIMGDHSKTAIGTRLNTGTICGVNCNIFSDGFPPKYIPSFSWAGPKDIQTYKPEKAFETMQAVMARRDVAFTEDYKKLMKFIFEHR